MLAIADVLACLYQLPGFVAIHSPDDRILWASSIRYGLDDSVLGQYATDYVVPEDRERWQEAVRRVRHNREVVDYQVRCIVPEPPGWLSLHGRLGPVVIDGEVKFIAILNYDATFRPSHNKATTFLLGPQEREIVATLLAHAPLKSTAIAHRLGEPKATSVLRTILASLVGRGVLTSTNRGYAVAPAFRHIAGDLLLQAVR